MDRFPCPDRIQALSKELRNGCGWRKAFPKNAKNVDTQFWIKVCIMTSENRWKANIIKWKTGESFLIKGSGGYDDIPSFGELVDQFGQPKSLG